MSDLAHAGFRPHLTNCGQYCMYVCVCVCVCAVCIYIMNCASKLTTVLGGGVVSCSQPHPSPMF